MHTDHTVHPNAVIQLRDALVAFGLDAAGILRRSGLPTDPPAEGPRLRRAALLEAKALASRAARDPGLGFRLGAHTRLDNFSVWGAAMQHAPSLTEALRVGVAHLAVWEEGTRVELVPAEGARVQVRYESFTPASARAVEIDGQQTVVFLLGLARSWFGARAPIAAGFACGPPRHPRSAPPAVACRYGEPAWYVEIPNPEEARLVRPPHPALGSLLARALAEESDRVARPLDLRGRVRDLLRARVASAPTLAAVASMVGMSPRSLQAQLKRAETTFADELAAVRVEGARALLADPDVSVKAVAQAMGFSETAVFTRFFRRQTGSPPSRFARPEEP